MLGISAKVQWQWKGQVGNDALAAAIDNEIKSIKNWKPFFRDLIHVVLEPGVAEQFYSEGKSGNTEWVPLAESTVATRIKQGFPGSNPILRRTGRLFDSFFNGPDHVQTITNDTLTWGTSVPYAPIHQKGGHAPTQGSLFAKSKSGKLRPSKRGARGGAIPPRPILVFSNRMKSQMNKGIARFAARGARDSGFMVRGITLSGRQLGFSENDMNQYSFNF